MTYFGFLLQFLVIPILILGLLNYRDRRQKRTLPTALRFLSPRLALGLLAMIAVIYTTPWDNYLVATRVWWYDPALVTGITLGWVPLEEYTFFVLQTVLTGLWWLLLARRLPIVTSFKPRQNIRVGSTVMVGMVWVVSIVLLLSGWKPGKYLSLELAWALPAIALQLAVGADILWHYRRLIILTIGTSTLYLCVMDALAISSGTWTINPVLTLRILLGGILPVEEAVFFLLTNTLLTFGLLLALTNESKYRLPLPVMRAFTSDNRHSMQ